MKPTVTSIPSKVDEAGVRLAPVPLAKDAVKSMPAVKQELVIIPKLQAAPGTGAQPSNVSTAKDYQPKARDISKRWKRTARSKNFVSGLIMLIACAAVFVPFILAALSVKADSVPFKLVPERFDVVNTWISAFRSSAELGWNGEAVRDVWLAAVPCMILTVGLLGVLINFVKAVFGVCGAIKPKHYLPGAIVFVLGVLAIFIAALVGAESIGIEKTDFMNDFVRGWQSSELFTLLVTAGVQIVFAVVCSFITPQRTGYTR